MRRIGNNLSVTLLALAAFVALPTLAAAPPAADPVPVPGDAHTPPATGTPPFDLNDPARIAAGKARFGANCAAYCHGFEGSGGKTPPFRGNKELKQDAVFRIITEGRRSADIMPAWGNGFSAEKRWELVAYIMYLAAQQPAE